MYTETYDPYENFEQSVNDYFNSFTDKGLKLFTTNSNGLFEAYLNNLPSELRQEYNCRTCKNFIERFGGLVVISEDGTMTSALWDDSTVPAIFIESVKAMKDIVLKSKVNGVFISDNRNLGTKTAGGFNHLNVVLPKHMINPSRLLNANQLMAEKAQDFIILTKSLLEYPIDVVSQVFELFKTDSLYRSERFLNVAEWFYKLHTNYNNAKGSKNKQNIIWLAVATTSSGFCHIKSSMIGTLLDDIAMGMTFDSINRRYSQKMSTYMRSQSAPAQGNIDQAEKIFEKLGISNSLRRRYATIDEISDFIWRNVYSQKKESKESKGIFSNVTAKNKTPNVVNNSVALPSTVMTWEKFKKTILPTAENIEVLVDNTDKLMALVTAADETSENILQWDNPFSWYYQHGIDAEMKRRLEAYGAKHENNEIRCSLMWEGLTDLDLHCITPNGQHLFYGKKRGWCGGWLDLDMNGLDKESKTPVENMRWEENAPEGHYVFYVNNYNERVNGYNGTPFKAEIEINEKVFHHYGEPLKNDKRVTIFEFDYKKGEEPSLNSQSVSSVANDWNIVNNSFVKLNGIINSPNMWGKNPIDRCGKHIFFLLDNCKDLSSGKGRGFFTESLKSELHEIRKTLEAYTANTEIENADNASACGVGYSNNSDWNLTLKVTSNNSTRIIKIDRWD